MKTLEMGTPHEAPKARWIKARSEGPGRGEFTFSKALKAGGCAYDPSESPHIRRAFSAATLYGNCFPARWAGLRSIAPLALLASVAGHRVPESTNVRQRHLQEAY